MFYEAGLLTFLRTVIIIVGVYYFFKLLVRFLFPILLNNFLRKQTSRHSQNSSFNSEEDSSNKEKQKPKEKLGDYVDFEEIDD